MPTAYRPSQDALMLRGWLVLKVAIQLPLDESDWGVRVRFARRVLFARWLVLTGRLTETTWEPCSRSH